MKPKLGPNAVFQRDAAGRYRVEAIEHFPFESLDGGGGSDPSERGELLRRVFDELLAGRITPDTVFIRVIVMAHMVQHPRVHDKTLAALAKGTKFTKAGLYRAAGEMRKKFGIRVAWARSEEARRSCSEAAAKCHAKRKVKE